MGRVIKEIECVGTKVEDYPCFECCSDCSSGTCEKMKQFLSSSREIRVAWAVVDRWDLVLKFLYRVILVVGTLLLINAVSERILNAMRTEFCSHSASTGSLPTTK